MSNSKEWSIYQDYAKKRKIYVDKKKEADNITKILQQLLKDQQKKTKALGTFSEYMDALLNGTVIVLPEKYEKLEEFVHLCQLMDKKLVTKTEHKVKLYYTFEACGDDNREFRDIERMPFDEYWGNELCPIKKQLKLEEEEKEPMFLHMEDLVLEVLATADPDTEKACSEYCAYHDGERPWGIDFSERTVYVYKIKEIKKIKK